MEAHNSMCVCANIDNIDDDQSAKNPQNNRRLYILAGYRRRRASLPQFD